MATFVLTNAYVSVNGVDLSDHVETVKLTYMAESVEDTTMGNSFRTHRPGLKTAGIEVTFFQDYASGKVDATLFALVGSATAFTVVVKADAAAPTNNTYTLTNCMLSGDYMPVTAKVGEMQKTTVKFEPQQGSTLTRS